MVVHRQVRIGHAHLRHFRRLPIQLDRGGLPGVTGRPLGHATRNPGGVQLLVAAETFDHVSNSLDRVLGQQLEYADVLPHPWPRAVTLLQTLSQLLERRRQLPTPVDVRVVQRRRTPAQRYQIVQRIEHLVARFVAPPVAGNHPPFRHHLHPIDVALDRHRFKGPAARHAVPHLVEMHQLVLVHFPRLHHARIKGVPGQRQRCLSILLEQLADRLLRAVAIPLLLGQATFQQIRVQLVEVLHLRNRRRPATLKRLDPVLHVRLLIATGRHAKQRIEHVVTRQRSITRMQPALATDQQFRDNRLRVVPPDFSRHATKILQAANNPLEDRFGSLGRQGQRKRVVRVRPHQDQHPNGPPALGKIDIDLAKIRFHALARIVEQRNERLTFPLPTLRHVTPHCVVAAPIPLGLQTLEDPHRRVTLLRRRLLVCRKNLVDETNELAQLRVMLVPPLPIRPRLTAPLENRPNLLA